MRLSDRDCYSAMIRALSRLADGTGIELPTKLPWVADLESFAERLGVRVRRWGTPQGKDGPRLILDHAPSAYGGGVRPMLCEAGKTGEHTPRWWSPSAGLGPGAVPRREFIHILDAVGERA